MASSSSSSSWRPAPEGWERGWTIFADRDGDGKPGPGDETILEQGVPAGGIHIQMKFTGSASQSYIAYNSAITLKNEAG